MIPFSTVPEETIGAIGEIVLLQRIRSWLGETAPPAPWGMGDDCAVLPVSVAFNNLVTVDSVFLNRHFTETDDPAEVGSKLLKRNISDIAAMGGHPVQAVVAMILPENVRLEWLEGFASGIRMTAEAYSVRIIGGDLSSAGDILGGTLTLLGQAGRPVLRQGAGYGNSIYVTGELGGSILGKHLSFQPRIEEGAWLAALDGVTSMIDVTDGLGKDLSALLNDGLSAAIDLEAIPVSKAASALSMQDGIPALHHAVNDGEDYELLFSVDKALDRIEFEAAFTARFPELKLSRIGYVEGIGGSKCKSRVVNSKTGETLPFFRGYEYF